MGKAIITIDDLSKAYGDFEVLKHVNLEIQYGDIYGLIGKSGAGKSTLLRCINGLEKINSGTLTILDQEISALENGELRHLRKDIGMIFQNYSLIERKTIYENIALPMRLWKYSEIEIDERVKKLAKIVGTEDKLNQYPRQLSGGQKQRVGIARALALNPKILLSDEATSALDPETTKSILQLLLDVNKRFDITMVIVTHELEVVKEITNKVSIMKDGKILLSDYTNKVFLEEPEELKMLTGEDVGHHLREGYDYIRVIVEDYTDNEDVVSNIVLGLGEKIHVVDFKVIEFNIKKSATFVIETTSEQKVRLVNYLEENGMTWRVENGL